jgi:hypothetical protein
MLELNPVEIQKATEERAGGEGQTPLRKMIEGDDFIYIFHGKRLAERRAPIDEVPLLKQAL